MTAVRLAAIAAAWAIWLSAPGRLALAAAEAGATDPAQAARDVFRDPQFWWKRVETKTVDTSWMVSIAEALAKFLAWIVSGLGEWIGWLLKRLFRFTIGGSETGTAIVWIIVGVLLVWAVWMLLPVVLRWLGALPSPSLSKGAPAKMEVLPESADLFEQAGLALTEGHHAEAIRLALLALIARLEKQGLLRYDTSRTNREYQRELRPSAEIAAGFGRLARIYDRVWYGGRPAGREDAEQAIGLCRTMIAGEGLAAE
ncbi:MAG: DUF4129 domain-containing protein [Isosphaeraceae bacterium]